MLDFFDPIIPMRIWSKIIPEPNSGCWLWIGAANQAGYGLTHRGDRHIAVHRWIYEAAYGPYPPGLQTDHKCRMTCCCNPAHLEAVTPLENSRRAKEARDGKGYKPRRDVDPRWKPKEPKFAEPICVRLPTSLFKLVQKLSGEANQTISEFIRDSINQRVFDMPDKKIVIRAKRLAVGIARVALTDALDAIDKDLK